MSQFAVEVPINSLSFGNVSVAILREMYKKKLEPDIFVIGGNVDISAQKPDNDFKQWLQQCSNKALLNHKRTNPVLKVWHLNGSLNSVSNKQFLFTFHETDFVTPYEANICQNNEKIIVSSRYSEEKFRDCGVSNVEYIPLGFDSHNFEVKNKKYFDDRIVFGLCGKLEKRKAHRQVIQAWVKKFGNDARYYLNCAITNPFIHPEDQHAALLEVLEGKSYFNVNFNGFMPQNQVYNDFLNCNNIIIGMSRAEAFCLPTLQSLALGKHGVILNAHVYKDYANTENAVLVNPNGKQEVYDNMFFHKGQPFNQGNVYTWNDEAFIAGCEEAVKRVEANPVNEAGLKLQQEFTYEKTTDAILSLMGVN